MCRALPILLVLLSSRTAAALESYVCSVEFDKTTIVRLTVRDKEVVSNAGGGWSGTFEIVQDNQLGIAAMKSNRGVAPETDDISTPGIWTIIISRLFKTVIFTMPMDTGVIGPYRGTCIRED